MSEGIIKGRGSVFGGGEAAAAACAWAKERTLVSKALILAPNSF